MTALRRAPIVSSGLLLGCGLGGFVDGIVLHQLLQWHNMLSSVRPPTDLVSMKFNMVWDGVFHTFTWLMVVAGLVRLWLAGKRTDTAWSTCAFIGALLLGWGLFNLVEGTVDHEVLGIHHVHPGANESAWDIAFLLVGASQIAVGYFLTRDGRVHDVPPGASLDL